VYPTVDSGLTITSMIDETVCPSEDDPVGRTWHDACCEICDNAISRSDWLWRITVARQED